MLKPINIIVTAIFFIFLLFSLSFSQESMTITTYYPSPYGVYKTLRLYPGPRATPCQTGEMTYHDGSGGVPAGYYFCDGSGTWQPMGAGYWAAAPADPDTIYNTNRRNVVIGATRAISKLQVNQEGNAILNRGGVHPFAIWGTDQYMLIGVDTTRGVAYISSTTDVNPSNISLNPIGGNVGIGTASPGAKLEVAGVMKADVSQVNCTTLSGEQCWGGDWAFGYYKYQCPQDYVFSGIAIKPGNVDDVRFRCCKYR